MHLSKHHGLGNDFLVALDADGDLDVDADLARSLCDRRRGVGADGLIVARPAGEGAAARMLLWNADGSRAELSGNGLRCLGQALVRAGWAGDDHVVSTDAGPRQLRLVERIDDRTAVLAVEMGTAAELALPEGLDAVTPPSQAQAGVDVGNPHIVLVGGEAAGADPGVVGPAVEALVPGGVNVHLVAVSGLDELTMSIWERGAGRTEACGTGATAAAWAARRLGLVADRVRVVMPGGTATVLVGEPLVLEGPATHVADLEVHA
ncbi:MAG: diaminopimelate epimerase [Actinomycetota bacterium]